MSTTSQQPAPPPHDSDTGGELPEDLLVRAAPPREARLAKTRDREADLMARMEKSMLKAAVKEEGERARLSLLPDSNNQKSRLPKPGEILQEAVGPAGRVESHLASSQPAMKLLVVAREGSGFPVLGQFLTKDNGIFEHGEPSMELSVVGNLFNCILSPEMVITFDQQVQRCFHPSRVFFIISHRTFHYQVKGHFGDSPYFREECLLDSQAVCSDPLSYELM